jgi:hypothetical protein
MKRVWQIAGGPAGRSYSDVFVQHGVGLIGPGDPGPWTATRPDTDFGSSSVRRYATRAHPGDIVLLRAGNSVVRAVGLIASDYLHLPQFDDVNGWDLQHARRIRWRSLPEPHDFGKPVFGANPNRFGHVNHTDVVDFARRFVNSPPTDWQTAPLPPLPAEEPSLPIEDVPDRVRPVLGEVQDLLPLMWDRAKFGEHPTEDELVAHFVLPLLRALGWRTEQLAVEWRDIDVTLFRQLPRIPTNCHLLIEAKRLGAGVEGALAQAKRYATLLGQPLDVVVTDGVRYRLYAHAQDYLPVAYANLTRLKRSSLDLFTRLARP